MGDVLEPSLERSWNYVTLKTSGRCEDVASRMTVISAQSEPEIPSRRTFENINIEDEIRIDCSSRRTTRTCRCYQTSKLSCNWMCVFLALSRILDGTCVENPGTEANDDLNALDMKALQINL